MQYLVFNYLPCLSDDPNSDPAGSAINWPPGSETVDHHYGSEDPNPKEIFTDPQR
jgi:hypothetical protein